MYRIVLLAGISATLLPVWAGDPVKSGGLTPAASAPAVNSDAIIAKFAAKEKEFSQARQNYTYRQTAKLQELDESGGAEGKWEIVEDVIFSPDGKRTEHV